MGSNLEQWWQRIFVNHDANATSFATSFNVMELGVPGSKETTGNMYFGEHDPFYNLGGATAHCFSD
jgi:hypothetical protein